MPIPENKSDRIRLGILGSGEGTNFSAIAGAITNGRLNAEIVLVVSDNPGAGILHRARALGVAALFVDPGPYKTMLGDAAQQELADRFLEAGVDCVICAGFMRRLKEPVLRAFPQRILNVHPSLLPQFAGRDAVGDALAAGVAETGCTVHLVDENIDAGEIIAQRKVPVLPGDTRESLLKRVHAAEHEIYPDAIAAWCRAATAP